MRVKLLGEPLLNVELSVEEQVKRLFLPLVPKRQAKFMFNPLKYGVAIYERCDMLTFSFVGIVIL